MARREDVKIWLARTKLSDDYEQAKDAAGGDIDGVWYKFKGGNLGNNGDVRVQQKYETTEIDIKRRGALQGEFTFRGVRFHSLQPDISVDIINHKRIRITSLALIEGIVPYDVIVEDVTNNTGELIYCHPRIINDWNLNLSVREVNDMQSPAGGDTLTILDDGLYEG